MKANCTLALAIAGVLVSATLGSFCLVGSPEDRQLPR